MTTTLYTTWALNDKARRWLPIVTGQAGDTAAADLVTRQDTVRRNGFNTRFTVLPDGEQPR